MDNNYNVTVNFDPNITVGWGGSGVLIGSAELSMDPSVGGISSVDIESIDLAGQRTLFGAVSTNISLPLIAATDGDVIDFIVTYENTYEHLFDLYQVLNAAAGTNNATLAAGATGSQMEGVVYFYSTAGTLTAIGFADEWVPGLENIRTWRDQVRLYLEEGL
jgi:hypothetical protein